jgi:DNA (cytosine-5)-methyltransferase 1
LPDYFVFENVDNLKTINQGKDWEIVQQELSKNYNIYADILDAKNYNIPQSRKRLFVVGIRKDIRQEFKFPEKEELKISFTELLEKEVNPKYYLSQRERQYMDRETKDGRNHWDFMHYHDTKDMYSHCIVANTFKGVPYNVLADRRKCKYGFYDCDFIDEVSEFCNSCTSGDCMQLNNNVTSGERKLTPMECFRLMGFDDKDYYILKENNISDTQLFIMSCFVYALPVLLLIII